MRSFCGFPVGPALLRAMLMRAESGVASGIAGSPFVNHWSLCSGLGPGRQIGEAANLTGHVRRFVVAGWTPGQKNSPTARFPVAGFVYPPIIRLHHRERTSRDAKRARAMQTDHSLISLRFRIFIHREPRYDRRSRLPAAGNPLSAFFGHRSRSKQQAWREAIHSMPFTRRNCYNSVKIAAKRLISTAARPRRQTRGPVDEFGTRL